MSSLIPLPVVHLQAIDGACSLAQTGQLSRQAPAPSSNQRIFSKRKKFLFSTFWGFPAELSGPDTPHHTALRASTAQNTYSSASCLQGTTSDFVGGSHGTS